MPEWGGAGLKIGGEEERETHFWKGVKALYRRNLIQLLEEGHALVIMAVLICKVYEVRLVHAPGVKRGEWGKVGRVAKGNRQKGEVGSERERFLGFLDGGQWVTCRDAGGCCCCRKPRARGFCPKVFICMAQVYTAGIFLKVLVYVYPYHWLNCPAT